jgi:hypothetical protein
MKRIKCLEKGEPGVRAVLEMVVLSLLRLVALLEARNELAGHSETQQEHTEKLA